MSNWISVADSLPQEHQRVLCCSARKRIETGIYRYGGFWICGSEWMKAKWWMPLPEPPTK